MTIINKTPHAIDVVTADGTVTITPTLPAARVTTKRVPVEPVDGIPVDRVEFGPVVDLPAPQDGVFLLVSAIVASAPEAKNRTDLLVVGEAIRDATGKVTGCKGLSRQS
jgi:hypothetical protein